MITEISAEQEALIDIVVDEYEKNVLSGDDSYDVSEIEKGINFLYSTAGMKNPEIVICPSPLDMADQAGLKKGETIDYIGCGFDSGWTAFYDYMQRIGVEYDSEFLFSEWKDFITKSGVFATVLREKVAFVCIRPCVVSRDADSNLHNETEMAIKWRDGYGEFFLHGVSVPENIVITPAEKLDTNLVMKEQNAEVRREILRKIGIERFIQKTGARTINKQGDYELLQVELPGENETINAIYLKMKNPSIGVWHVEAVPPDIETVEQAINWRKSGDKNRAWKPIELT